MNDQEEYHRTEIKKLETQIQSLQKSLQRHYSDLRSLEATCRHVWGETKCTPIEKEGYRVPGDPPGTMGVDRREDFYVAPQTIPQWTRICDKCGKVEITAQQATYYKPKFEN